MKFIKLTNHAGIECIVNISKIVIVNMEEYDKYSKVYINDNDYISVTESPWEIWNLIKSEL